jgi:hypothetical protein
MRLLILVFSLILSSAVFADDAEDKKVVDVKEIAEMVVLNGNELQVKSEHGQATIAVLSFIDLLQNDKVDEHDFIGILPMTWGVSIKVNAHSGLISYMLLPEHPFTPLNVTQNGIVELQRYVDIVLQLASEQTKLELEPAD